MRGYMVNKKKYNQLLNVHSVPTEDHYERSSQY